MADNSQIFGDTRERVALDLAQTIYIHTKVERSGPLNEAAWISLYARCLRAVYQQSEDDHTD